MNRRAFLRSSGTAGLLALGHGLAGCASGAELTLAIHPWIGYESLFIADDFGWLPTRVHWLIGDNATDSMIALEQGRAQLACLTLDEMLRARGNGVPLTAALVMDVSSGADALLAKPGLNRLDQLAGVRLGVEHSALGALILETVLTKAGLSATDLILIDLPPDRQLAAWQAGEVDAVISYQPTLSRLEQAGMQRLFDSRDMPETVFDVLAVRSDLSGAEQPLLRQVIAGHFRGLEHLRTNVQDAVYRIATHLNLEPGQVQRALSEVVLPGVCANRAYLSGHDSVVLQAAAKLSERLLAGGLIRTPDPLDDLLSDAWLPPPGETD